MGYQEFYNNRPRVEYGPPTPNYRVSAGNVYDRMDRVNIMSILKVGLVIVVILVLFVFGKGILTKVKGWFGMTGNFWDGFTGGDNPGGGGDEQKKKDQEDHEKAVKAGSLADIGKYKKYLTPSNVKVDTRPWVDEMYKYMDGWWYQVTGGSNASFINNLANRNKSELILACRYWDEKYSGLEDGQSMYEFIEDQTTHYSDFESPYKVLLKKLKDLKLTGKMKVLYSDRK